MTSYLDNFPKIRLVLLDHISSPSALVLPLREMIAECRKRRVLVMVDGAHAVGQLRLNLEDLGADFYFGSCSKWLYTPRGCAVLWVAEEHQKWCTPLIISLKHRTGFHSEFRCQGTRDNVPYLAVPEAIQFLEDIGGLEKVHAYTEMLLGKACRILWERLGAKPVKIPESIEAPNIRLIQLPVFPGYPVTYEGARRLNLDLLEHHKVVCLICAIQDHFYLRLSANVYNEVSDFVKLADALCELSRTKTTKVYTVTYKCKM
uniref:Uncharacterized protein LOC111102466 isoform X1 n=1 Tax=Crassostrea virginica TaxID=6565 RepID=A0A8B8AIC4_CRAVI|nr:uncharacterized protein LOC111102466 isoform X1 [Crassostrea virginica]XP_022290926.1 uncharacterized protein LOC111102466 isoform X1 [Crassostrea virginica]